MSQAVLSETEIGGGGGGMGEGWVTLPGNVWCLKSQSAFIEGHAASADGGGFIHQLVNEGIKIRRSGWECLTIR